MKIDRLMGILTLLLQHEKMTAPALAARFEVSRRTINRDIEDICKAGIPVVTTQGANGGISIMDHYKIDKTIFTERDFRAILAGLSSLDSVAQDGKYQSIMEKFSSNKEGVFAADSIRIDLSSHYKITLAPKIELLQESIAANTRVAFLYCNKNGERQVLLDPYLVVFQWANWYAFGVEAGGTEYRLYKLNRIQNLEQTDQRFPLSQPPAEALDFNQYFTDTINAVVLFDQSERFRLVEAFGSDSFHETEEGDLRFCFPFTNQEYLMDWVLGFGEKAQLLEPVALRPLLRKRLEGALTKYTES